MNDIKKIIQNIKTELGGEDVQDKAVAIALGMTPNHISLHKRRDSIPFKQIIKWCTKNKVSLEKILVA